MARLETGVHLAVEILAGAGGGEEGALVIGAGDGRADGDELVEVGDLAQLGGNPGHAVGAVFLRFFFEPVDGGMPTFRNQRGELSDLATAEHAQPAGDAAGDAERLHAVADDQPARGPAFLSEAEDLIARQAADDHGVESFSGSRDTGRRVSSRAADSAARRKA